MLRFTDITGKRIDKVETAIARIKSFQPEEGYYLAFSGGKDSICIKRLADMAGAKYEAHYNVTTVDPPELTRFIKRNHPDVIWNRPEYSMQKLIARKGIPPTRYARYCCEVLKEGGGKVRIVLTGVRWAESPRRRDSHGTVSINKKDKETGKRIVLNDDNDESRRMVEQCYRTTKTMVNPIIDWEDEDVWEFIKEEDLPYCSLYDEGFKRLGMRRMPTRGREGHGARIRALAPVQKAVPQSLRHDAAGTQAQRHGNEEMGHRRGCIQLLDRKLRKETDGGPAPHERNIDGGTER